MHSTNNIDDGYMGSGKRLRRSIRKYGEDNHTREILEFFDSRELLVEAEKVIITDDMIDDKDCMNLMGGGTGGFVSLSACTKGGKISGNLHSKKLKEDKEYSNKHSKLASETLKTTIEKGKIKRCDWTGRKHSEESKKKMSESMKGKCDGENNPSYGTCWITNGEEVKKIKKEKLNSHLEKGWRRGRK